MRNNVIKTNYAFRGYAMSYKVGITEKKDPIKQLEHLFSNLWKYQITLQVMLKKYKSNGKLNLDKFVLFQQQKQW